MMFKSEKTETSRLGMVSLMVMVLAFFSCGHPEDAELHRISEVKMEESVFVPTVEVFDVVEVMPKPQGGQERWNEYLGSSLRYPTTAREKGIEGTVYMSFVVNEDGSIRDAEVLRGIGAGCDEAALQVIKNSPRWEPGKQGVTKVNVRMRIPIRFSLGS